MQRHTVCRWTALYIKRWLTTDVVLPDGTRQMRNRGTPQGGVTSSLLANLFLHYAFDKWMERHHPTVLFECYAMTLSAIVTAKPKLSLYGLT